jgi:uncharacterized protein YneF (UPF0154 family)
MGGCKLIVQVEYKRSWLMKEIPLFVLELILVIISLIVGFLLGIWQSNINWRRELRQRNKEHSEEMQLLRDQLQEQKEQREFDEKVYKEENKPKQQLAKWNIKS